MDFQTHRQAKAAVVYLPTVNADNSSSLLTAKSKVAPFKTISIPRLKLSAALFLTRPIHFVRAALQLPNLECYCWTNSTVTLTWLNQLSARWKMFVANRVSAVQSLLSGVSWHHVPTQTNPASRTLAHMFEKPDL